MRQFMFCAVLCVSLAFASTGFVNSLAAEKEQTASVEELLSDLGARYDMFFTIEQSYLPGKVPDLLAYSVPRPNQETRELRADLDYLATLVPHFSYGLNPTNPKIIHIIDQRLTGNPGYALDRMIESIDYSGPAESLPAALAKKGIPISEPVVLDSFELLIRDARTQVKLKAVRITARDALSDYIPLEGRTSKVLWYAKTEISGTIKTTYVIFVGAAPLKKKES